MLLLSPPSSGRSCTGRGRTHSALSTGSGLGCVSKRGAVEAASAALEAVPFLSGRSTAGSHFKWRTVIPMAQRCNVINPVNPQPWWHPAKPRASPVTQRSTRLEVVRHGRASVIIPLKPSPALDEMVSNILGKFAGTEFNLRPMSDSYQSWYPRSGYHISLSVPQDLPERYRSSRGHQLARELSKELATLRPATVSCLQVPVGPLLHAFPSRTGPPATFLALLVDVEQPEGQSVMHLLHSVDLVLGKHHPDLLTHSQCYGGGGGPELLHVSIGRCAGGYAGDPRLQSLLHKMHSDDCTVLDLKTVFVAAGGVKLDVSYGPGWGPATWNVWD